ncbi:MAG: RNA methyltransferase [Hyphomonadaceae bacterium]|nr:RNA methyltransferase [Hyphomonadaceae bacterium]
MRRPAQHTGRRRPTGRYDRSSAKIGGSGWIWGTHAVLAVLANPARTVHRLLVTEHNVGNPDLSHAHVSAETVHGSALDNAFGSSHQGVAVQAAPLEWPPLDRIMAAAPDDAVILVLDRITDPHNVGAMFRLASAFGASAIIMQTRYTPPLSGATAKVAVGCVETVPACLVTNIADTLKDFQRADWPVTGLAGEAGPELSTVLSGGRPQVIVMGSEDSGLRPRVRDHCDQLARIPMYPGPMCSGAPAGAAESLNVATAAAIALYEVRRLSG